MCTKAFLPAGEAAVVSVPTYPMYRIHAEQRGGRVIAVPRLGRDDGWAMDLPAVRRARSRGDARLDLQPEQPDRAGPSPTGAIERLLDGHRGGRRRGRPAGAGRRGRRGVQRVQRRVRDRAADALPEPRRGPDRLQGVRARGPSGRASRSAAAGDDPPRSPCTARPGRSAPSPPPPSRRRCATSAACARTSNAWSASVRGWSPALEAAGLAPAAVGHQLPAARPRHAGARGGGRRSR